MKLSKNEKKAAHQREQKLTHIVRIEQTKMWICAYSVDSQ